MLWIIICIIKFIIEILYVIYIYTLFLPGYRSNPRIEHGFYQSILKNDIEKIKYYVYIINKFMIYKKGFTKLYGYTCVICDTYENIKLHKYLYFNNICADFDAHMYGTITHNDFIYLKKYMALTKKYKKNTDIDIYHPGFFHMAIMWGTLDMVKYLYSKGINIYYINNYKENSLDIALHYNRSKIIKYIFLIGIRKTNYFDLSNNPVITQYKIISQYKNKLCYI